MRFIDSLSGVGYQNRQFLQRIVFWSLGRRIPWHFRLKLKGNSLFCKGNADLARVRRTNLLLVSWNERRLCMNVVNVTYGVAEMSFILLLVFGM